MKSFDIGGGEGTTVYGDWDDTHGYQFMVMWGHSAGIPVTVITFGGSDYGGGILSYAEKVPYINVMNILEKYKNDDYGYDCFCEITDLVNLHKK